MQPATLHLDETQEDGERDGPFLLNQGLQLSDELAVRKRTKGEERPDGHVYLRRKSCLHVMGCGSCEYT